MLSLAIARNPKKGKHVILASRNVHSSFVSAAILLGFDVVWIYGKGNGIVECKVSSEDVEKALREMEEIPDAVYLTSPDYYGNMLDIEGISEVVHKFGSILLVDNAHGAYLAFLKEKRHPIKLGADMCADSAHKTLPALTGTAYLHVSDRLFEQMSTEEIKAHMLLFGSTSPSYLLLSSLDEVNDWLSSNIDAFNSLQTKMDSLKKTLETKGYKLLGDEPFKVTIDCKNYGYNGEEFFDLIREKRLEPEYYNDRFVVLMFAPASIYDMEFVERVLLSINKREPIQDELLEIVPPIKKMTMKEAFFAENETMDIEKSVGKVVSYSYVKCPPATTPIVGGEVMNESVMKVCLRNGINKIKVVKG